MIERINNEIVVFPEPKVIIYKDYNKVSLEAEIISSSDPEHREINLF